MDIRFNIKPRVIEGHSKLDVLRKAGLGGWCCDNHGSRYLTGFGKDNPIKVVNLEKRRKKVKVLKSGNRKVLRRTYWVGYVYDFTKFKGLIKVTQKPRNFTIVFE